MKSKPVVMEHFSTVHTSYILNFDFTNNITILTGSSATGKTASFSFMRADRNGKRITACTFNELCCLFRIGVYALGIENNILKTGNGDWPGPAVGARKR